MGNVDAVNGSGPTGPMPNRSARAWAGTAAARDKQVFWFYFRYGMTAKAIAAIPAIGLSQKGVESLIFRLVDLLKEKLAVSKGIGGGGSSI